MRSVKEVPFVEHVLTGCINMLSVCLVCPPPAACSEAFVTCVEVVESGEVTGRVLATNVFERQGGAWKLVHHHASPAPPPGFR